jgi:vacuolar-type H+-ATPase subunit I/STV1
MTASRIIAAIFLGLAALVTAFTFAIGTNNMAFTGILSILAGAGTAFVALRAPSGRQAWGRGFLGLAATLVVMPMLLASALGEQLEGHTAQTLLDDDHAMGQAVVSSMLLGISTLIGFFFGAIALALGLILNRAPAPPYRPPQDMTQG